MKFLCRTKAFRRTAERRNKMVQSPSYRQKKAHNEYHFVPSCRKTKSSPLTWPKNGPSLPPGLVPSFPHFYREHRLIIEAAAQQRIPAIYEWGDMARAGGLMAYGPVRVDIHQRVATDVDKILQGAKPADLPVEQPTKFELVINLKTA